MSNQQWIVLVNVTTRNGDHLGGSVRFNTKNEALSYADDQIKSIGEYRGDMMLEREFYKIGNSIIRKSAIDVINYEIHRIYSGVDYD